MIEPPIIGTVRTQVVAGRDPCSPVARAETILFEARPRAEFIGSERARLSRVTVEVSSAARRSSGLNPAPSSAESSTSSAAGIPSGRPQYSTLTKYSPCAGAV